MHTIRSWCRANAMLVISLLAAAATAFFVPPDSAYLGYYDLKTLSCLLYTSPSPRDVEESRMPSSA